MLLRAPWPARALRRVAGIVGLRRAARALIGVVGVACLAPAVAAQVPPDSVQRDSIIAAPPIPALPPISELGTAVKRRLAPAGPPPLQPGRAFLMSFVLPGLAQSRLDRTTSGALFAAVEMAAIGMLRRSRSDLGEVRRQWTDTVPGNYLVDPITGALTSTPLSLSRFDDSIERTRRLHVEDWIAVLAFNHLISAADAFVAAQLWDVPTAVSVMPTSRGWMLAASVGW